MPEFCTPIPLIPDGAVVTYGPYPRLSPEREAEVRRRLRALDDHRARAKVAAMTYYVRGAR